MKKLIAVVAILILVLSLTACGSATGASKNHKIVVGSLSSDYQVWSHIAKSEAAKKVHLDIQVKDIEDGVQLNDATKNRQVDVNAFQSYSYFLQYNKTTHAHLVAFATTYLEPMAIYSKKVKKLADLKKGATIAIPNDAANRARALRLLSDAGLIKLKSSFTALGSPNDILANPKKFKFTEVKAETEPRILPDVDAAAIGNSIALQAKLNSLKDSIYHEQMNQHTKANVNILVTTPKKAKNKYILELGKLYHDKDTQNFIKKEFGGTKVPIQKSVASLAD
ncbi:MAG: MetQ/NlpA family ABC transporter substrate-binding protein [Sporolactobacillus sp.]